MSDRSELVDAHDHGVALGKILGVATAAFDGVDSLDMEQWNYHKGCEIPVIYYRGPCAHGWQIDERDDGKLVLNGAADPSDFALLVFETGFAVSGGAVSSTHSTELGETLADYIAKQVETLEEK